MSGEVARYPVGPLRKHSGRTLRVRLTLAAPRVARLLRVVVQRFPPASRIRRAFVAGAIQDVYEAYNRRDWDALLAMAHPEFERRSIGTPRAYLDVEDYSRGREGYLRFMESFLDSWDDFRLEPQEVIDFGERVLVLVQRRGRGRVSGVELDQPSADIYTFEGGWAVRYDDYFDRERALADVGLAPETGSHGA